MKKEKRICKRCGKEFDFLPHVDHGRVAKGQYCSRKCYEFGTYEKRICQYCGKEFDFQRAQGHGKPNAGQYCSQKCHYAEHHTEKVCPTCGKTFTVWKCYNDENAHRNQKYCSAKCANRIYNREMIKCVVCGKEYLVKHHQVNTSKSCSVKCRKIYVGLLLMKIAADNKTRLHRIAWKEIRNIILKRDGNQCTKCGKKEDLIVHHIVPWRKCREDSEKNLITLCRACHTVLENYGRSHRKRFQQKMIELFG
jgi:hypothetical protein